MKTIIALLSLALFSATTIAADSATPAAAPAAPAGAPAGHPAMPPGGHGAAGAADMSKADAPLTQKGKVLSVVDAKQFTYIEVQDGKTTRWVASPAIAVKAGNTIRYAGGDIMPKFHSKTLNRDFANVMFTTRVVLDK